MPSVEYVLYLTKLVQAFNVGRDKAEQLQSEYKDCFELSYKELSLQSTLYCLLITI
jgi:hypothetical protein